MNNYLVCACIGDRCQDARVIDGALACFTLHSALDIARRCGWVPPRKTRGPQRPRDRAKRDAAIELVRSGRSICSVADELGLARSTLQALCVESGVRSAHQKFGRDET